MVVITRPITGTLTPSSRAIAGNKGGGATKTSELSRVAMERESGTRMEGRSVSTFSDEGKIGIAGGVVVVS